MLKPVYDVIAIISAEKIVTLSKVSIFVKILSKYGTRMPAISHGACRSKKKNTKTLQTQLNDQFRDLIKPSFR